MKEEFTAQSAPIGITLEEYLANRNLLPPLDRLAYLIKKHGKDARVADVIRKEGGELCPA
jgi:hypothetical protein